MKEAALLELIEKWQRDFQDPDCQDGSPEAELKNARDAGFREGVRHCASQLSDLIILLGD